MDTVCLSRLRHRHLYLSLTPKGNIRYLLKISCRESLLRERGLFFGYGTTHVIFAPLDFIASLAAAVPWKLSPAPKTLW